MSAYVNLKGSQRYIRLDALRGILAIGVVFFHCGFYNLIPWYWASMDFFFVMSGFLITKTMIQIKIEDKNAIDFFVYRACRLLPSFFLILLCSELVIFLAKAGVFGAEKKDITQINGFSIYYLSFIQNLDLVFFDTPMFPRGFATDHLWSLVLEEQFYLIWGLAFFCHTKASKCKIFSPCFGDDFSFSASRKIFGNSLVDPSV